MGSKLVPLKPPLRHQPVKVAPTALRDHPVLAIIAARQNELRIPTTVLAKRAGVDLRSMRAWRRGDSAPNLANLALVCQVLGLVITATPAEVDPLS